MDFPEKPKLKNNFDHGDIVRSVCFSPNQKILCSSGCDSRIVLWDLYDLKKWKELKGDSLIRHSDTIWCVDYSNSGKLIVSASSDTSLILWRVNDENGTEAITYLKEHTDYVRAVRFTYDGTGIISGGDDETIKIWNIEKQNSSHTFNSSKVLSSEWVWSVDVTRDSRILCSSHGLFSGRVMLWDLRSKTEVHSFLDFETLVFKAKIHTDSHCIASGSGDQMVNVFDIRTFKLLHKYENHSNSVRCLSFHPIIGKYLISGGDNSEIFIFDLTATSGKSVVHTIKTEANVNDITFSPEGNYFSSGHENGEVLLWESKLVRGSDGFEKKDEEERILFLNEQYFCDGDSGDGDNNIEVLKICIRSFNDCLISMYISKLLF